MSRLERLLALEAAFCACKGIIPESKDNSIREFLDEEIKENFGDSSFFDFIDAQKAAVIKLSNSPEVFGGG